jgi:hypothetical protein
MSVAPMPMEGLPNAAASPQKLTPLTEAPIPLPGEPLTGGLGVGSGVGARLSWSQRDGGPPLDFEPRNANAEFLEGERRVGFNGPSGAGGGGGFLSDNNNASTRDEGGHSSNSLQPLGSLSSVLSASRKNGNQLQAMPGYSNSSGGGRATPDAEEAEVLEAI